MRKILIMILTLCLFSSFVLLSFSTTMLIHVISIREVNKAIIIEGIHKKDTIKIVSFKEDLFKDSTVENGNNNVHFDTIKVGCTYDFNLIIPKQVRVDYITRLYSVVIDKDTIWKGYKVKNLPYYSINSRGLLIVKKN